MAGTLRLFLCGDVMLGRGIDQVLGHPGDPALRESSIRDARDYVRLAEEASGPVPRPVGPEWPWGDALPALEAAAPDARVVNLETSVTVSADFAAGKQVHYRMHPANLPALRVVRPDAVVLANNHVLDFGRQGLLETLDVLAAAGLRGVGAGRDAAQAELPAEVSLGDRRLLVFAVGTASSGIPSGWAATAGRPGVAYVADPTVPAADALIERVDRHRRHGDVVVVSVHWGGNWGHEVPPEQVRFAHRLVDGGVDVVHGHSSHHPRAIEVHRGKLVLYGCGDLVDDYEGIRGYAAYRPELRLLYLADLDPHTGRLTGLHMTALRARRLRLEQATAPDAAWLAAELTSAGGLGAPVDVAPDGSLVLRVPG